MAISTAAAILGAAVIGGGASYLSGRNAANKAADASQAATDANIALQRDIYNQTRADNEPFRQNALAALNKLNGIMGLQSSQTDGSFGASGAGSGAIPGSANYAAYLQANPDVMAEFNEEWGRSEESRNYLRSLGINSAEDFAGWHYQNAGQAEGRQMPVFAASAPATATDAATPGSTSAAGSGYTENGVFGPEVGTRPAIIQPTPYQAPELGTAPVYTAPTRGPAPVYTAPTLIAGERYTPTELSTEDRPEYNGYTPTAAPTFTREADPTLDLSREAWVKAPGYEAAVQEGQDSILAERAALGSMESGAFWKALQDHGQKTADKFYYAWADRTRDQHNRDVDRKDFRFENDRNAGMRQWEFTNSQGQNDAQFGASLKNSQWQFGNTFRQNENQFGAQLGENQRQFDNNFNLNNSQFGYNALSNNYWRGAEMDLNNAQFGYNSAANNFWNGANYNQRNAEFGATLGNNQNQFLNNLTQSIYDTDRNYLTGRFDTQNNVLLNMAGMGQTANAQNANAGQNMANNTGNALFNNAATQGNAALSAAAQQNNTINNLVNAGAYIWGGWGGGSNYGRSTTNPSYRGMGPYG